MEGFPTIKYGDPLETEDYEGEREYTQLSEFAKENLKPRCSPLHLDLCDEEKKAAIKTILAMSEDELDTAIEKARRQFDEAEETFLDEESKLHDLLDQLYGSYQAKRKAMIDDSMIGIMKAVKVMLHSDAAEL